MRYCVTCGLPVSADARRCESCAATKPMTPFTDPRGLVPLGAGIVGPGLAVGYGMLNDDEPLTYSERRGADELRKRPKRKRDLGVWEKLREIG